MPAAVVHILLSAPGATGSPPGALPATSSAFAAASRARGRGFARSVVGSIRQSRHRADSAEQSQHRVVVPIPLHIPTQPKPLHAITHFREASHKALRHQAKRAAGFRSRPAIVARGWSCARAISLYDVEPLG